MNIKWFLIVFLPLVFLITIYPPFQWEVEPSSKVSLDYVLKMHIPIKQHGFLFGADTRYFTVRHYPKRADGKHVLIADVIPLKRHIAPDDIVLHVFFAAIVSLVFSVVIGKKTAG